MKPIPIQEQVIGSVIEYEFDVAGLLAATDTVSNVSWDVPVQLAIKESLIVGTKVSAKIEVLLTATVNATYWVTFTVVGSEAVPVTPTLSFPVRSVTKLPVMVI